MMPREWPPEIILPSLRGLAVTAGSAGQIAVLAASPRGSGDLGSVYPNSTTLSTMPDRPDHICCPICHATVFQRVVLKLKDGASVTTELFSCANCTCVCRDPVALTRAFEDRPTARRPPTSSPAIQAWSKINARRRERE